MNNTSVKICAIDGNVIEGQNCPASDFVYSVTNCRHGGDGSCFNLGILVKHAVGRQHVDSVNALYWDGHATSEKIAKLNVDFGCKDDNDPMYVDADSIGSILP